VGRKRRNFLGDGKEGTEQSDDQLLSPWAWACTRRRALKWVGKFRLGLGWKHAQRVLACIIIFWSFSVHIKDVEMDEWKEL
jgi:hypothetical protein